MKNPVYKHLIPAGSINYKDAISGNVLMMIEAYSNVAVMKPVQ